jgi:hypothetical protein
VIDWLNSFAQVQRKSESPWLYPKSGDQVLYIYLYETFEFEMEEPERLKSVLAQFGGAPAVSIAADVSGRHDGTAESIAFVSGLLREFDGVATDEFTDHLWTQAEIERGQLSDGTRFFDFRKAHI